MSDSKSATAFLSYKLSQDRIELLFGRIRRMGGFSDDPNAVQLRQALRRLALHNFITPSATGNTTARDGDGDDGLLRIRRPPRRQPMLPGELDVTDGDPMPAVMELVLRSKDGSSAFTSSCVAYISGYVCRKLLDASTISCAECIGALLFN